MGNRQESNDIIGLGKAEKKIYLAELQKRRDLLTAQRRRGKKGERDCLQIQSAGHGGAAGGGEKKEGRGSEKGRVFLRWKRGLFEKRKHRP